MTVSDLRACTRKELAARAKRHQISGWHEMSKDELIQALIRRLRSRKVKSNGHAGRSKVVGSKNGRASRSGNGSHASNGRNGHSPARNGAARGKSDKTRSDVIAGAVRRLLKPTVMEQSAAAASGRDRLVARIHDAYWIFVQWTLTGRILDRAAAALGAEWHQAVPVLRLFDVTSHDAATCSKKWVRDVEIHGEIDHWYVPVDNPPRAYRLHIGYRTPSGQFFAMAQSNRIQMPRPGSAASRNGNGNGYDHHNGGGEPCAPRKLQDLRTAQLARGACAGTNGEDGLTGDFPFELETELIVHGSTHPDAELTLLGDRVPVRRDGTFSLRFCLPNGRQVIPAVAIHPHGAEQRTIVLGIERNTKELEPQPLDETGL